MKFLRLGTDNVVEQKREAYVNDDDQINQKGNRSMSTEKTPPLRRSPKPVAFASQPKIRISELAKALKGKEIHAQIYAALQAVIDVKDKKIQLQIIYLLAKALYPIGKKTSNSLYNYGYFVGKLETGVINFSRPWVNIKFPKETKEFTSLALASDQLDVWRGFVEAIIEDGRIKSPAAEILRQRST